MKNRDTEETVLPAIALAGNPNVGKSTLFNALTGMHQHTGNWPGKTVSGAQGICKSKNGAFLLVDTPGAYSLAAHSAEEEVTRDFLFAGNPAATAVVCDATCLERNLNLVLQILELTPRVYLCVNLMDEARRKGIGIDLARLEKELGVPVFGVTARKKSSLAPLTAALGKQHTENREKGETAFLPHYGAETEEKIARLLPVVQKETGEQEGRRLRFLTLRYLEGREKDWPAFAQAYGATWTQRVSKKTEREKVDEEETAAVLVREAERIAALCVHCVKQKKMFDRKLDRILTGKFTAFPVMLVLLAFIFWLTVTGANYPSALLSALFARCGTFLATLFAACHAPPFLQGLLLDGVYRTLSWVVSVMLPPMAIFFPLFTLLEDAGFLPRIAYNLDRPFQYCHACGKQGLSMCMGFGCNAAGVVGCRIIDSPRERLLAILTNSFVPCNGRFPAIISILLLFFVGGKMGGLASVWASLLLTGVIIFSVLMTFLATKLLAVTFLRGTPSAFTLELPPYRPPQIGRVLVRSVIDRTLFVLGRAAAVAAPAGAVIWLLSYFKIGGATLLMHGADILDPFARLLGLDGVILLAFLLGFPANEIVIPIALMVYTAGGSLIEMGTLAETGALLQANGWDIRTGLCFILFSVLHFPCSTTLLTVKKETGRFSYTLLAALLPTVFGILVCMLVNGLFSFFR